MREIKRNLLNERNLPREAVHTHGYWQYGEANHPDHDLGQEIEYPSNQQHGTLDGP